MNKTADWIERQTALCISDALNLKSKDFLLTVGLDPCVLERMCLSNNGMVVLSDDSREISKIKGSEKIGHLRILASAGELSESVFEKVYCAVPETGVTIERLLDRLVFAADHFGLVCLTKLPEQKKKKALRWLGSRGIDNLRTFDDKRVFQVRKYNE